MAEAANTLRASLYRHLQQKAVFAPRYSTNYLIDVDNAIILDVEATTAIRQAEVLAAKHMIERSMERFDLHPAKLMGDNAYLGRHARLARRWTCLRQSANAIGQRGEPRRHKKKRPGINPGLRYCCRGRA
jgi:hypothetical protein